jgi:hypothetical protein
VLLAGLRCPSQCENGSEKNDVGGLKRCARRRQQGERRGDDAQEQQLERVVLGRQQQPADGYNGADA